MPTFFALEEMDLEKMEMDLDRKPSLKVYALTGNLCKSGFHCAASQAQKRVKISIAQIVPF